MEKPTVLVTARNPTASPIVDATVPIPTLPCSTTRVTTVRMIRPSTSSTTAAPSTVRASTVARARKSPKTRAVMPIDVAVSVAPTKREVLIDSPSIELAPKPSAIGKATPMIATKMLARPTLLSSTMSVSSPTWINSKITPSSARKNSMSLVLTRPNTDGPIRIPAVISPITAGIWMRSEISAANLATSKIIVKSSRMRPTLSVSLALPIIELIIVEFYKAIVTALLTQYCIDITCAWT